MKFRIFMKAKEIGTLYLVFVTFVSLVTSSFILLSPTDLLLEQTIQSMCSYLLVIPRVSPWRNKNINSPIRQFGGRNRSVFREFIVQVDSVELSVDLMYDCIERFWGGVITKLEKNQYVKVFIILKYENEKANTELTVTRFLSLTSLMTIKNTEVDRKSYHHSVRSIVELKDEGYYNDPVTSVIFKYRIITLGPNAAPVRSIFDSRILVESKPRELKRIFGYNLPLPDTSDYTKFGTIFAQINNIYYISNPSRKYNFRVTVLEEYNLIEIFKSEGSTKDIVLTVKDYFTKYPTTFKRSVNNLEYFYRGGQIVMKRQTAKSQFLTSLKPHPKIKTDCVITMDLETFIEDGVVRPFLISYYDGSITRSFYLSDFANEDEMLMFCLMSIVKSKYNGYVVYLHNLSKFDSVFLMRHLAKKIHDINENIKRPNKDKLPIDDQLFLHQMMKKI